jgi:hypothetical protein
VIGNVDVSVLYNFRANGRRTKERISAMRAGGLQNLSRSCLRHRRGHRDPVRKKGAAAPISGRPDRRRQPEWGSGRAGPAPSPGLA